MNALTPLALFLQETAPIADPAAPSGGFGELLIPMAVVMVLFYVIMLGPERKQRKKREEMLSCLKKGQEVMTTGGLYGKIAAVNDDRITLIISDGVRVKFNRTAIQGLTDEAQANAEKAEKKDDEAKVAETAKA